MAEPGADDSTAPHASPGRTASSGGRSSVPKRPFPGRSPPRTCRSPPAARRRRPAHSCIGCAVWHPSSARLGMPEKSPDNWTVSGRRTAPNRPAVRADLRAGTGIRASEAIHNAIKILDIAPLGKYFHDRHIRYCKTISSALCRQFRGSTIGHSSESGHRFDRIKLPKVSRLL